MAHSLSPNPESFWTRIRSHFISRRAPTSEPEELRQRLMSRSPLDDASFVLACGVQPSAVSLTISRDIRQWLAEKSGVPANQILPGDTFPTLRPLFAWGEFEESFPISQMADELGVRLDHRALEKILDPSIPSVGGSVGEFVSDLHNVFASADRLKSRRKTHGTAEKS